MPTTTRTIRVFISSTFSDLKAERNALQERVFPCLKRYCQRRGWSFQAIDLRWGISNEAALDQSTMRICRAEIARCQAVSPRPNFVVLLGDRHGWRPLPDEIPAAEFEALLPHLPVALANRWYRLDENAVCSLPDGTGLDKGRYILQPRTDEFKDYDKWVEQVEGPLGDAFRRAARELGLPEDARLKYEASATAQEIHDGAFAVPDAGEHVVAFIREIRTADGQPLREALPGDTALKDFVDLKRGELDRESQAQLDALKQKLHAKLGKDRIKTYPARWEGDSASTEHVHRLSLDVLRSLGRLIHTQIKQHSVLPPLEEERLRHQEFAQRRARDFTGQAGSLGEIERYLAPTSGPAPPLVVHGASGSGKSALLAKAVQGRQTEEAGLEKGKVIARFIGATANSTDLRSLLEGLCRELGERYGADNHDLPLDLNKLIVVFRQRLELATAEQPLTLFLDALDQLQMSEGPDLSWLPGRLPAHVRLVVSAIPGPTLEALKSRLPSGMFLELGPMPGGEAEELLQKWLQRSGRRLAREEQRKAIREAFARCSLPLYLRLAFEEAQRWRSYDKPPPPSPDVDGLIERLFNRLSEPANHGPLLVERAVSYLRCSRHGLSEDEMLDLLAQDDEYWKHFRQSAHHALPVTDGQQIRRLPVVIWSRLYHDLEPYLSWRSADGTALMVFFHTRFNEVADRQFLGDDNVRRARHDGLATYFRDLADPTGNGSWTGQSARGWSELAFHLFHEGHKAELQELLMTYLWIRGRFRATEVTSLIADYDLLEPGRNEPLGLLQGALTLSAYVLSLHSRDLPTQLTARLLGVQHPELQRFLCRLKNDEVDLWLRPLTASLTAPGGSLLWTLVAQGDPPESIAVTPDGRQAISGSGWIFGSDDKTIKVWDLDAGTCIRSLEGHAGAVHSIAVTPDGRRVVSGSRDGTLKIWDLGAGSCLRTLKGHRDAVHTVAVTADGRRAISGSWDTTLKVWDLEAGMCLRTLEGHGGFVLAVAVTPHGLAISGSSDNTLKIWDLAGGACVRTMGGHRDVVEAIATTPDGRKAISGSHDKTVKVWDFGTGSCLWTMEGHDNWVCALAVTADGQRAISGSDDNVLKIWDLGTGNCLRTLEGHGGGVHAVAMVPRRNWAISGARDGALKVWDLESGIRMQASERHSDAVKAITTTPDGGRAISASWDKTLKVWDLTTGNCLQSLEGHEQTVCAVMVTPDGREVISASHWDEVVKVWDSETGACLRTILVQKLAGHAYTSWSSVFVMADGRPCSVSCTNGSLEVLDLETGDCLRKLEESGGGRYDVAATPDGRRAISWGTWQKTIAVWDFEAGTRLFTLKGHRSNVRAVAIAGDGRRAISASDDCTLKYWNLETGACLRTLEGHGAGIVAVAATPDERRAVSGSTDQALTVWDLVTGETVATFTCEARITACTASPDGLTFVVGDSLGRVHFLRLEGMHGLNTLHQ